MYPHQWLCILSANNWDASIMLRFAFLLAVSLIPSISFGQFVLQPGETIVQYQTATQGNEIWCDKCQTFHAPSVSVSTGSNYGGALSILNAQRARRGIAALMPDAALQAVAERRAAMMATSGRKRHPRGSFSPGRYEGVGWTNKRNPSEISACYTEDSRMQSAGAAMVQGDDGTYFCVVYR